jgi:hypothetical protein
LAYGKLNATLYLSEYGVQMTYLQPTLVALALCITSLGTAEYLRKILRREVRPNVVSWLVWTVAPLVGAHVALSSGAGFLEVARTVAAGVLSCFVVIAVLARSSGLPRVSVFDLVCGILALASIVLWVARALPYDATCVALLADTIATVPTVVHAWREPRGESLSPYLAGLLSSLLALPGHYTFELLSLAFPVYFVLLNMIIVVTVLVARSISDPLLFSDRL